MNRENSAAKSFLISSCIWLAISTIVGGIVAAKFVWPYFLKGIPWLSFGRLRPIHVNGALFGWLSMAYVGAIFYIVPKLLGTKLWSERLGNITCLFWNILIVLAAITLANGLNQGVEYAELIWPLDLLVALVFILLNINIWMTFKNKTEDLLYVSLWYILASILWTPLVYLIGNGMLFPVTYTGGIASTATPYTGVNHAAVNWFYGHNVIGLWFTTVGVGIAYFLLPVLTKNPIYSHRLGLIGFWVIAFVYVWTGQHHLLYGPGPDWLETVAIVFSVSLLIPVWTVLVNFWGTLKGKWHLFFDDISTKWLVFGGWWYFLTCLQGPLTNAVRPISKIVHFTNWVVGHAHLAVLGAFTYILFSFIYYVWPYITGKNLNKKLGLWHFWLTTVGLIIFMMSLWIAGLIQGVLWTQKIVELDFATDKPIVTGIPFINTVTAVMPYYIIRFVGGLMMIAAQLIFVWNILGNLGDKQIVPKEVE